MRPITTRLPRPGGALSTEGSKKAGIGGTKVHTPFLGFSHQGEPPISGAASAAEIQAEMRGDK
ncbi:MAG: hypothetical protein PVJ07_01385 [Anaerolineales bacterium]